MSTPTTKLKRHGDTMRGALVWSGTDYIGATIQSLTTAQRDATSPSAGAVIYNSDDAKFQMYVGSAWSNIASEGYASGATDWKPSVTCATTANISLTGEQTIDGVLTSTDRVLVKDQSSGSENGIYVTAAGAWARATDFDSNAEVTAGATMFVSEGATLGNTTYQLTTDDPIVLDTTALVFAQIAGGGFSGVPQSEPATDNLFIGTSAGAAHTSGNRNTIVGAGAGLLLTSGAGNTIVGANAADSITTGQNNVCVGNEAGEAITSEDNNVLIGNGADAASANNICVGHAGNAGTGGTNTLFGCNNPTLSSCFGVRAYEFTAANQIVFGGSSSIYYNDVYIGNGIKNAAPVGFTLQPTGGEGTDIDGADVTLAGGKATGSGDSGDILFKQTAPGQGTGTTLRSLATVGQFRGSDETFQVTKLRNSPELAQTLTDQASIDWDCDAGGAAVVTITDNRTMAAPTNIKNGARYTLTIVQDPTGTRTMGWNSVFKFAGGSTPTLSTGGNDIDIFEFIARGGNFEEINQSLNVS